MFTIRGHQVRIAVLVLALICFALPFFTVTCAGQQVSVSGLNTAFGTTVADPTGGSAGQEMTVQASILVAFILGIIALGLGIAGLAVRNLRRVFSLICGGAAIGSVVGLLVFWGDFRDQLGAYGSGVAHLDYGYWLALVFFVIVVGFSVWLAYKDLTVSRASPVALTPPGAAEPAVQPGLRPWPESTTRWSEGQLADTAVRPSSAAVAVVTPAVEDLDRTDEVEGAPADAVRAAAVAQGVAAQGAAAPQAAERPVCGQCGTSLLPGSRFCVKCGALLSPAAEAAVVARAAEGLVEAATPAAAEPRPLEAVPPVKPAAAAAGTQPEAAAPQPVAATAVPSAPAPSEAVPVAPEAAPEAVPVAPEVAPVAAAPPEAAPEVASEAAAPAPPAAGPAPAPGPTAAPGPTPGALKLVEGPGRMGQAWMLPKGREIHIGRDTSCFIALTDGKVSRRHARLSHREDGLFLTDLGSSNGTRVNQVLVGPEPQRLMPGDKVRVGDSVLEVVA